MPLQKTKSFRRLLSKNPLLRYVFLTFGLMCAVFLFDRGGFHHQANILSVPDFDGTALPITVVPNWEKTGTKNTKSFDSYSKSELIRIPEYNAQKLASQCAGTSRFGRNQCVTYSTVYMGNYKMDHQEHAGSHLAVDIRVPEGTPVYAAANGRVEKTVSRTTGFGKYIVLHHPNAKNLKKKTQTLFSSYSHLSKMIVSEGSIVKKGDLIGFSGNTGTSSTPHLHFQVDTDDATFHPWWPFTSRQASNAGLSFYQAVNAGLGQSDALEKTISPMLWVQSFLNTKNIHQQSSPQKSPSSVSSLENTRTLGSFAVRFTPRSILSGGSTTLLITARDEKKRLFPQYDPSDITIDFTPPLSSEPKISFSKGKAQIVLKNISKNTTVAVRDGKITAQAKVSVQPKKSDTLYIPRDIEDAVIDIEEENAPEEITEVFFSLSAPKAFLVPNQKMRMKITAVNALGEPASAEEIPKNVVLLHDGVGHIDPSVLKPRYFKNGVAFTTFSAEENPGSANISVEQHTGNAVNITVISPENQVSSFGIETDGRFTLGESETITLITQGEDGNILPKRFRGSAQLEVVSGKAKLSKTRFTTGDFRNGQATTTVIPLGEDSLVFRLRSGVIVGTSKEMRMGKEVSKKASPLFPDVQSSHENAKAISFVKDRGIFSGDGAGFFRPESVINRAEFTKVLLEATKTPLVSPTGRVFSDIPKNSWYAPYVETAVQKGFVQGYKNGTFGPQNTINRAELFTILSRMSGGGEEAPSSLFSDIPNGAWFASAAAFAGQNHLLDFSHIFAPSKPMLRREVAEVLMRFFMLNDSLLRG